MSGVTPVEWRVRQRSAAGTRAGGQEHAARGRCWSGTLPVYRRSGALDWETALSPFQVQVPGKIHVIHVHVLSRALQRSYEGGWRCPKTGFERIYW